MGAIDHLMWVVPDLDAGILWGTSPHPSADLPTDCALERLEVFDPDPGELTRLIRTLDVDGVEVQQGAAGARATLRTRSGTVEL